MRPADGVDAFFADPEGTFLRGRSWACFCVDQGLFGQIYWGHPEAADLEALTALWQVELQRPPHDSYVDASGLVGMDASWFEIMQEQQRRNGAALAEKIQRQALVRPAGFSGALVAGVMEVLKPPYPVQVFAEPAEALYWLGRRDLGDLLVGFAERLSADEPLLLELQRYLARALVEATLASAARAAGVSDRTLQRRLQEAGTSFVTELQRTRIATAKTLLADGHTKLTAIALEVGCRSLQHFSRLFHQATGMRPSDWRARHTPPQRGP